MVAIWLLACGAKLQTWLEVRGDVVAEPGACESGVDLPRTDDKGSYLECSGADGVEVSVDFEQTPDWSDGRSVGAAWPGEPGDLVAWIYLWAPDDAFTYRGHIGLPDDELPDDPVGLDVVCSLEMYEISPDSTRTEGVFQCDQLEPHDVERAADAVKTAGFTLTWGYE